MEKTDVRFRGLFTIVRHSKHLQGRVPASQQAEPMTILFPHGGVAGQHAHLFPDEKHEPLLCVRQKTLDASKAHIPLPPAGTVRVGNHDYVGYEMKGWTIHLPTDDFPKAVGHDVDEAVTVMDEPKACDFGKSFDSLSYVFCLNTVTQVELGIDPTQISDDVLTLVKLSGGHLRAVKSEKPLGNGFFEFYTNDGTVALQPAVEEVMYRADSPGGVLTFDLANADHRYTVKLTIVDEPATAVVLQSMPNVMAVKHDTRRPFHHFALYYALMKNPREDPKRREPLLRYHGRCIEGGTISHLVPAKLLEPPKVDENEVLATPRKKTTDEGCPCFCSQVFI